MNYQVVHAIEGRIRIRIPQLAEENFGQQLKSQIEQLKAVKEVRINSQATSIVITYRDRLVTDAAMQEELHHIIEQLLPPDPSPNVAPTVAPNVAPTEPTAPAPDPVQKPDVTPIDANSAINLDEDVWADLKTETVMQNPTSATGVHLASEPKIPEAEAANETLPSPLEPAACSTALLAKRLGVSIQAINLRRSKPEFAVWSQSKDPDGIGWSYQEASKQFVPIQPDSVKTR